MLPVLIIMYIAIYRVCIILHNMYKLYACAVTTRVTDTDDNTTITQSQTHTIYKVSIIIILAISSSKILLVVTDVNYCTYACMYSINRKVDTELNLTFTIFTQCQI